MHKSTFIQITKRRSCPPHPPSHHPLEVVYCSGNAKLCMPLDIILTNKQLEPTFLYLPTKIPWQISRIRNNIPG